MRVVGRYSLMVIGGCSMILLSGCVSLAEHDRLRARNRTLVAEKESTSQELFDTRTSHEALKARVGLLERELAIKSELITNLRSENEVLDQMNAMSMAELERMGRKQLGDIMIVGPKLPEPLHNALKIFAEQQPGLVVYDEARGTVKWQSDLLFALGSDVVKESSLEGLRRFTEVLNSPAAADFEVVVVGHTDNRPIVRPETKARHPSNWHLSANRAISVASAVQRFNYPPERIGIMGYGEYRPLADNASEAGAAQNRRVEVYLIPRGSLVASSAGAKARSGGSQVAGRDDPGK
jgi:chemotaxis protein MotB